MELFRKKAVADASGDRVGGRNGSQKFQVTTSCA
jgi:hypothetical protein